MDSSSLDDPSSSISSIETCVDEIKLPSPSISRSKINRDHTFHEVASAVVDYKPVTFTTPTSTASPANGPSQNSSTRNAIRTVWHGVELLLEKAERCLGGTPAKAPVAAFNAIIEIINVCFSISLCIVPYLRLVPQAVADNQDAFKERVIETMERLETVNAALLEAESEAATVRMQTFSK